MKKRVFPERANSKYRHFSFILLKQKSSEGDCLVFPEIKVNLKSEVVSKVYWKLNIVIIKC